MLLEQELTEKIIAACIEVHRALGPGLLESAYQACVAHELALAKVPYEREKPLPIVYKGLQLEASYRIDFVVDSKIVLELKAIDSLLPVHEAQLLTYLRLSGLKVGLLINFAVPVLKNGIIRRVL